MSTKITKATFKSFLKKNAANLYVIRDSRFDGMTDGVERVRDAEFVQFTGELDFSNEHTLGCGSIWLVGSSRDYFEPFTDEKFEGIRWSNCCGSGKVAIKK